MISARQMVSASAPPSPSVGPAAKRFHTPDQLLAFESGRLEVLTIAGESVAKGSYVPGWRWSDCAPQTPTPRGSGFHVGLVLSGRARLRTEGGSWVELTDGDVFHASFTPGYDLWVVGSKPCEVLYLRGVEALVSVLRGPR